MGIRAFGLVLDGIDGVEVTVEARYSESLRVPEVKLVGLPDAAVKEGVLRARSASARILGSRMPHAGVLMNLSPADLRKSGRSLDLALAMVYAGLLLGVEDGWDGGLLFLGELGLSGVLRPVTGALAAVGVAREKRRAGVVLPRENLEEARLLEGPNLYPVGSVEEAFAVFRGEGTPDTGPRGPSPTNRPAFSVDLSEIRGQFHARRGLEIAAAGRHNMLMEGPPGSGKTMLARRLPSILPLLDDDRALATARVQSAVRVLDVRRVHEPPFRAPHHSATAAGLLGGGSPPRPGELSLAHHGVLFLDELPEFDRRTLEMLREPMEERVVHLTRASGARKFPADVLLLAAMNPCPCGYHGPADGRCRCTPRQVQAYRSRLSGPLLDRFDMRVLLRAVPPRDLFDGDEGESSAVVRQRVERAWELQGRRWGRAGSWNGTVSDRDLRRQSRGSLGARRILLKAVVAQGLSARATRRVERVARTIADLAESDEVEDLHMMEALGFRLGADFESAGSP